MALEKRAITLCVGRGPQTLGEAEQTFIADCRARNLRSQTVTVNGHHHERLVRVADRFSSGPGYAVGYCRPPKAYQWRTGQSGNPKGRPSGARNCATRMREQYDLQRQGRENRE